MSPYPGISFGFIFLLTTSKDAEDVIQIINPVFGLMCFQRGLAARRRKLGFFKMKLARKLLTSID